ncbi:uncharacterized protein TRIADDRAFT_51852 [Trichoplax adhaerens]|uniref:CCR4-NOT transcription complex subunit 4 n=1 Tax=Trichoplax adhaerens TaxID=10228 RepID=B3RL24_TRIAD|nr:hypothetical protein TRIADDRAFT_51852 [Trichoplax adhaerens]EDV28686.1 hypothetical protein TRIADDRAFT_51852 [Trichoplax adhaerens]|eukprot:XP_002107888.1 hypothetical protein TRIADDRAFT_51852 [Trichoplax adhaerens]
MSNEQNEEVVECPLCMEPLEDDLNFFPCQCGYQICGFCWHRIRTHENGLCPACRRDYGFGFQKGSELIIISTTYSEDVVKFKPLSEEQLSDKGLTLIKSMKKDKKKKDHQKKQKQDESRKHLEKMRVIQKNLVFVVGLSPRIATEEVLKSKEYFGKFGKITRVAINSNTSYAQSQTPSLSAYITYTRNEDALEAIKNTSGLIIHGRTIKTSHGTTKYCNYFLKNIPCTKSDCPFLHELGDESCVFTKDDVQQRSKDLISVRVISEQISTKVVTEVSENYEEELEMKSDVQVEKPTKGTISQNSYDKAVGSGAPNKLYNPPYMNIRATDAVPSHVNLYANNTDEDLDFDPWNESNKGFADLLLLGSNNNVNNKLPVTVEHERNGNLYENGTTSMLGNTYSNIVDSLDNTNTEMASGNPYNNTGYANRKQNIFPQSNQSYFQNAQNYAHFGNYYNPGDGFNMSKYIDSSSNNIDAGSSYSNVGIDTESFGIKSGFEGNSSSANNFGGAKVPNTAIKAEHNDKNTSTPCVSNNGMLQNVREWQAGFRSLLPNVNITFGFGNTLQGTEISGKDLSHKENDDQSKPHHIMESDVKHGIESKSKILLNIGINDCFMCRDEIGNTENPSFIKTEETVVPVNKMKEMNIKHEVEDITGNKYRIHANKNDNVTRTNYLPSVNSQLGDRKLAQSYKHKHKNNVKSGIRSNVYPNSPGRDRASNTLPARKAENRNQSYSTNTNSTKAPKLLQTEADTSDDKSSKVRIVKKDWKTNVDVAGTAIKPKTNVINNNVPSKAHETKGKDDNDIDETDNKVIKSLSKNKKKRQRKLQSKKPTDDNDLAKSEIATYVKSTTESLNLGFLPAKFSESIAVDYDKDTDPDTIVNHLEVEIENTKKEVQDCEAKLHAVIRKNCSISNTNYEKSIHNQE